MKIKSFIFTIVLAGGLMVPMPEILVGTHMSSTLYASSPANKDINVNANVVVNCNFNSGGGGGGTVTIAMGEYSTIGAEETTPAQSTGDFDFSCTKSASVHLLMDSGSNADGSTRRMLGDTGEHLVYELYKDAAFTERWGETAADCLHYTATTSSPEQIMVYAKVPEGQDVSVGTYTDNLTLTVSY